MNTLDWYQGMRERAGSNEDPLKLTIEKFELILADKIDFHLGIAFCPLCIVHFPRFLVNKEECAERCPVGIDGAGCLTKGSMYQKLEELRDNAYSKQSYALMMDYIRDWVLPYLRHLENKERGSITLDGEIINVAAWGWNERIIKHLTIGWDEKSLCGIQMKHRPRHPWSGSGQTKSTVCKNCFKVYLTKRRER